MKDEVFDAGALGRLRRSIMGLEDRVQIIDSGRPGHIGLPRYRLLLSDNQAVVIRSAQQ